MRKDIKPLINKFKKGKLHKEGLKDLQQLLESEGSEMELAELFEQPPIDGPKEEEGTYLQNDAFQKLLKDPRVYQENLLLRNRKTRRLFYAASVISAACLTFFVLWSVLNHVPRKTTGTQYFAEKESRIKPGGAKAKILLANGSQIDLESLKNDTTVQMQDYAIHKTREGLIKYIPLESNNGGRQILNTIVTPSGGEYQLELGDGTRIRINASSTLTYPIAFNTTKRSVELNGEAYFEVAKFRRNGKSVPFIVYTEQQKIEVLGTAFNVNSYDKSIKTTLVEGSIRLHYESHQQSRLLKPNEQATYDYETRQLSVETVDPFYTLAWKNGAFAFEKAPITEVMKEIARWYNVSISYEEDMSEICFSGSISKYEDISKLLDIISITGSAKFKIEGRRIVVMR